jgi:hypothetical protein
MVLMKASALLTNRALGSPLLEAQLIEMVERTNALLPFERPLLKLGEGATGIQKVAAHRCPAERQQDVQRQPGQLLVGTVAIADDDGLLRLQPGKMRAGDRSTAAGIDAVEDHRG